MAGFFLSLAVDVAIVSLFIAALRFTGRVEVDARWALASLALLATYFAAGFVGRSIVPVELVIPHPSWNWGGKILGILLWMSVLFALIKLKSDFRPADAGFVFKQNPASIIPAVIVLSMFAFLQVFLVHLMGGNEHDTEKLLFEALMPGLDEEPMFRGLLLYCLSLAVVSKRFDVFGAHLNVAGLAIAAIFGLGHGLLFDGREWSFSLTTILLTGLYGFILLWLRERTGSLVFPIVAHNTVNFVGQFV